MMQEILMNLPAQFMLKQRLFYRPSDCNLNQTIPTRLILHQSCVNEEPLAVHRAPCAVHRFFTILYPVDPVNPV
jgi:hypothetical protein